MSSKKEAFRILTDENILWRNETKHEALLLYKALYESATELRESLVEHVLRGRLKREDENQQEYELRMDYKTYNLLKYLEHENLPLTANGLKRLAAIRKKHPDWEYDPDDMEPSKVQVWQHQNEFSVEEIYSKSPKKLADFVKTYEETWERSYRNLCEIIGTTCAKNPDWCIERFEYFIDIVNELQQETMNFILWGLRVDKDENIPWTEGHITHLVKMLRVMIDKRPDGYFWHSLSSTLENWRERFHLNIDDWHDLAEKLVEIFTAFDFEREKKNEPIEWIQWAINHPLGTLTNLYLKYIQQLINEQSDEKKKYEIDTRIIKFLSSITENYENGARFGLCVMAERLRWFEFVLPDWTKQKLIPKFYTGDNSEQSIVVWSGYLWSRQLSLNLSANFKETYLSIARHFNHFGKGEQEGLVVHVAALVWFMEVNLDELKKFIEYIDASGRYKLMNSWENYLEKANKDVAEKFWEQVILPYWDWCNRQHYLALPDGNNERFHFWRLLPHSHDVFPQAVKKALAYAPSLIKDEFRFASEIAKSCLESRYSKEFVDILIAFIEADENPSWHRKQWQELWNKIRGSKEERLPELKDELAKKNIPIE